MESELVKPIHLARRAAVYVRRLQLLKSEGYAQPARPDCFSRAPIPCRRLFSFSFATAQRGVKAPFAFCGTTTSSLGPPPVTPRFAPWRWSYRDGGRGRLVELYPPTMQLTYGHQSIIQ